ncbi:MAG: type II toxin-antitoxin system RelE/ParE family toxin [Deltaproteobacteria bacterium]|nr:type II toxin-antitoxin system RelE/ParE family toxin [Deltaproteobacteria bacterium]
MKVKFTPTARRQFFEALEYIRRDNPVAARQFRIKTEAILQRLEKFPNSGHSLPEFPDLPHREVIVRPYRFFYRVVHSTIWIVALWHGAQLPDEPS